MSTQKIRTCLWFDGDAEEAIDLYLSSFPNSKLLDVTRHGDSGAATKEALLMAAFQLEGQEFLALNDRSQFEFTEAISLAVTCETQAEVDLLWQKLGAGGEPGRCGWLKDRFGVSWQIVPKALPSVLGGPDPEGRGRAMQAMLTMGKLDIRRLQEAYDGVAR